MLGAESIRVMYPLFQAEQGGSTPTSALQLLIEPIEYETAKRLNECWHSTLPRIGDPPEVMRAGLHYAATFDGLVYAVAIWSHPVNRSLPQKTWLELRRLAISSDSPRFTASRILGVMARLIRKTRPAIERLVSYSDMEAHTGSIYRAAGWVKTDIAIAKSWTSGVRTRPATQRVTNKQRWEKSLLRASV